MCYFNKPQETPADYLKRFTSLQLVPSYRLLLLALSSTLTTRWSPVSSYWEFSAIDPGSLEVVWGLPITLSRIRHAKASNHPSVSLASTQGKDSATDRLSLAEQACMHRSIQGRVTEQEHQKQTQSHAQGLPTTKQIKMLPQGSISVKQTNKKTDLLKSVYSYLACKPLKAKRTKLTCWPVPL